MSVKTTAGKSQMARSAATARLVDLHQDEFDRLHYEEREKRGLPGDPGEAKRQEAIARHIEALKRLGFDGDLLLNVRDEQMGENIHRNEEV